MTAYLKKYFLYIVCVFAYFISTVGNIPLSISHASSDDGIIAHAISYVYPEIFINDMQANTFRIETPTSLMNLIPALAYRHLTLDPVFFWVFFLMLQNILYPVSIYGIASFITTSRKKAIIVTILFLNFRPQTRNLSYSGDLDWMPYAMWLAESFFVFAIYLYFRNLRKTSYVSILISCLIHPSLGIWMLASYILFDYLVKKNEKKTSKPPILAVLLFSMFLTYNYFYIREQTNHDVDEDYLNTIFSNSHFRSVDIFRNDFNVYTIINSSIIFLVGLAIYFVSTTHTKDAVMQNTLYVFIKISFAISIIGILVQALGLLTKNVDLVRLLGTRFTSILAIFSFLLFLILMLEESTKNKVSLTMLLTFLFFPGTIVVWLYGVKKAIDNWFHLNTSKKITIISFTIISFVTSSRFIIYAINDQRTFSLDQMISLFEDSHLFVRNFLFSFIPIEYQILIYGLTLLLFFIISKVYSAAYILDRARKGISLKIFLLITLLFTGKMDYSADRFDSRDVNYEQIQDWAKLNSLPDSIYLILINNTYGGWRNNARRAQLRLQPFHGPYGYYTDNVLISHRIKQFTDEHPNENLLSPSMSLLNELRYRFSLDYVIVDKNMKKYELDIAFTNADFVVYKL